VFQNAVNVPSVSHDEYMVMEPYIVLSERLGAFLAQVSDGNLEQISLRYSGHIADWKTELVRNAAVKGILNQALEEKANLINAVSIADSRGLEVQETRKSKTSTGGAGSVLSILLKTSSGQHLAKGAVLHGDSPRLLAIDDIDIEAPLEKHLIYLRNRDVPGVIGKVGTILGEHSINIANFSLGRRGNGKGAVNGDKKHAREAVAVVHVDGHVPDQVLKELCKVPAIEQARAVTLF
jgi:D-3-phosphoglycerate dehydrogenase